MSLTVVFPAGSTTSRPAAGSTPLEVPLVYRFDPSVHCPSPMVSLMLTLVPMAYPLMVDPNAALCPFGRGATTGLAEAPYWERTEAAAAWV